MFLYPRCHGQICRDYDTDVSGNSDVNLLPAMLGMSHPASSLAIRFGTRRFTRQAEDLRPVFFLPEARSSPSSRQLTHYG